MVDNIDLTFTLQDWLKEIYETEGEKHIIKCKVCGDTTMYAGDDYKNTGWRKIEDSDDFVCHYCLNREYITEAQAKAEDEKIIAEYGSNRVGYSPECYIRENLTWEEKQIENQYYLEELKKFLNENDKELYEKYKDILE